MYWNIFQPFQGLNTEAHKVLLKNRRHTKWIKYKVPRLHGQCAKCVETHEIKLRRGAKSLFLELYCYFVFMAFSFGEGHIITCLGHERFRTYTWYWDFIAKTCDLWLAKQWLCDVSSRYNRVCSSDRVEKSSWIITYRDTSILSEGVFSLFQDSPPKPDMEEKLRSASSVDELMSLIYPSYWASLKCRSKLSAASKLSQRPQPRRLRPPADTEVPTFAAAYLNLDVLKSMFTLCFNIVLSFSDLQK